MTVPEADYISPNFHPYTDPYFKGTWIRIGSYAIKHFTAFADSELGGLKIDGNEQTSWAFLAPEQILENINHTWEAWETISSRLLGAGKQLDQILKDISGIKNAVTAGTKGILTGSGIRELGIAVASNLGNITKSKAKIDTPLVYENTERREYTMQFNLTAKDSDGSIEMMESVKVLQMHSSPSRESKIGIDLPFVFEVKSYPLAGEDGIIIDLPYAALTSIQPTYKAPYDENGYPMIIELTLTFKELPPLYAESFTLGI